MELDVILLARYTGLMLIVHALYPNLSFWRTVVLAIGAGLFIN